MCRLALKSADTPFSPYEVLTAMEAMQEGYDGSGLGLLLRGVEFDEFKLKPHHVVLSGIAHTEPAFHRLTDWMGSQGFQVKARIRRQACRFTSLSASPGASAERPPDRPARDGAGSARASPRGRRPRNRARSLADRA